MDVLNRVSSISRKDNSMYQTTWPHSTDKLQFHSTKGHHDTLYGSSTPPFQQPSSSNVSSFCNYTSSALVRIWEFIYNFHKKVCDRFLYFLHFPQSDTHSFSVHFINNITHSASPSSPPSSSLNHTANLTHHLATIHSNNPIPSLSHSTN